MVIPRYDVVMSQNYHGIMIPWHPDIPNYGWPFGSPEILDHVFASNSDSMNLYSTMYDRLYEYTLPGECPTWRTISHHFLMVWGHFDPKFRCLAKNYAE